MKVRCAVVLVLVAACGSDAPFADPAEPTPEECTAIAERWRDEAATVDRTCTTAADCVVIGGASCEGFDTTLGGCQGEPFNAAAYEAARSRLAEAATGWSACTCELVGCAIDCQAGTAICVEGSCAVTIDACF